MNDQQQDVFLRRSREQTHPHHRPSFQVERPLRFLDQSRLQIAVGPGRGVDLLEVKRLMFVDLLNGLAGLHRNRGSQGGMAVYQRLKRAPESRDVQIGANALRETDVVNRALRRELAQKPDPLLIVGERMKRLGFDRLSPQELGQQRAFFAWRAIGEWPGRGLLAYGSETIHRFPPASWHRFRRTNRRTPMRRTSHTAS